MEIYFCHEIKNKIDNTEKITINLNVACEEKKSKEENQKNNNTQTFSRVKNRRDTLKKDKRRE